MKKLKFVGLVERGDEYRVTGEDEGAIIIGGIDVVLAISQGFGDGEKIIVGIADESFDGDLFVETGWGYSEYTPMDSDSLKVGNHDLIEILGRYESQTITLYVSSEPINILDEE